MIFNQNNFTLNKNDNHKLMLLKISDWICKADFARFILHIRASKTKSKIRNFNNRKYESHEPLIDCLHK